MEQEEFSFQDLERILRIVDASPKEGTFTFKLDGMKLSVTKGAEQEATMFRQPVTQTQYASSQEALPGSAPLTPEESTTAQPVSTNSDPGASFEESDAQPETSPGTPQASEAGPESGHRVVAPLTGVFYRQPSPGADPFVSVGQHVEKGEVLAIIEVMKLMNRLTAPASGVVRAIQAENEDLVEHGKTLFIIDTGVESA